MTSIFQSVALNVGLNWRSSEIYVKHACLNGKGARRFQVYSYIYATNTHCSRLYLSQFSAMALLYHRLLFVLERERVRGKHLCHSQESYPRIHCSSVYSSLGELHKIGLSRWWMLLLSPGISL